MKRSILLGNSGTGSKWRKMLLAVAAAGAMSASLASAETVAGDLGAAGPGNFAIFSLGGTNLNMTDDTLNGPGQTTGNVGVASNGSIALNSSTAPAIIGNLYLGNSADTNGSSSNLTGPGGQVSGTIFTNQDAFLGTASTVPPGFWAGGTTTATGAAADALNAAKLFAGKTADTTISSITGPLTLIAPATTKQAGFFVIDVTGDINLGNGEVLTISAPAGTQVVLNVGGNITLTGGNGEGINLAGGLTPFDVVINVTSTSNGDNVTTSGGSSPDPNHPGNTLPNAVINGILLDAAGGIGFSPGMVNGEIIGGGNEIRLVSGSQVNDIGFSTPNTATTPLPSPVWAGAALMGGLLVVRKRKSSRRGAMA